MVSQVWHLVFICCASTILVCSILILGLLYFSYEGKNQRRNARCAPLSMKLRAPVADPEGGPGGPWPPPQTMRIQHAKISDNIVNAKYNMQTFSTTVCFTLHIRLGIYKKFQICFIYRSSDFLLKCMRKISPLDSPS